VRGVGQQDARENGAISVIVAIVMVCLLGFAALAVDVGVLYAERAQLQNSSDAVALMVAQKCAKSTSDPECTATWPRPTELAAKLANGNAADGMTNIKSIALDKTKATVSVSTGAKETGSPTNSISLFFARALGITSAEVGATSSAQWGVPSKGTVIVPLAIAECKFSPDPTFVQVLNMDAGGCGGIPGGFGWITDGKDSLCSVKISAGASNDPGIWFSSDTGASRPSVCSPADISAIADQTVLLPLYAVATGTGSLGKYYVKGFAAFHVTGYHFASDNWTSGGNIANKSIRGYFVKFVSLSQALELGGSSDYGTSVVRLSIGAP
jgi:Flp pilus assembly protein TadG